MKYDDRRQPVKAAPKRLNDAWELLEMLSRGPNGSDAGCRHLCAAYYLAGYAVECILKAYTILLVNARSGERLDHRSAVIACLRERPGPLDHPGHHSHNLGLLLTAAQLDAEIGSDRATKQLWGQCAKWDYAVRYMPDHMQDRGEVEEFVTACDAIYH
jgi:hypothetical protein